MEYKPGERVKVLDDTTAHGKAGTVLRINASGMIIVELDSGGIWPVYQDEIEVDSTQNEDPQKRLP